MIGRKNKVLPRRARERSEYVAVKGNNSAGEIAIKSPIRFTL